MKKRIGYFFILLVPVLFVLFLISVQAQPPVTSDSRIARPIAEPPYPGRMPVYYAPRDDVYDMLVTNERPLMVEVVVTSNVVRRTVWYKEGVPRTNETVLSSNVVSRFVAARDTNIFAWTLNGFK